MSEASDRAPGPLARRIEGERLGDFLRDQRWFASKTQTLVGVDVIEEGPVNDSLALGFAQVEYTTGSHELYQLVLGQHDGEVELDALHGPEHARALLKAIDSGLEQPGLHGQFCFRHVADGGEVPQPPAQAPSQPAAVDQPVRPIGTEQSNSSVVFGEELVLKLFRRLQAGINPELEMLRFLTAHDYPNIAPLYGWMEYEGEALAATLGIVQQFIANGTDGWKLALDEIPADGDAFLSRLAGLGSVTARLHSTLATDAADPAFSPEETSGESLHLLAATLDEEVELLFRQLPDDPRVAPIAGLEQEVRERIAISPQTATGGRGIRIHGDYHLGQILHSDQGWTLLDFEGEPARPIAERRAKRSPLRDVASMLRSFSYATWAVKLQRGQVAPEGFEEDARKAFLDAYLADVAPAVLPTEPAQVHNLLRIFELEKALYEVRYELDNRPDWVSIPVSGIMRIVETG